MRQRRKAAVIGGSGYGGSEMMRRLLLHPEVELSRVASIDYVGAPLWAAHPNLTQLTDLKFEDISPAEAAEGCDIVLLALPHRVTAAKVPELIELGVKIVDMSGDFRLDDPAVYADFYGLAHSCPQHLDAFVYGLPELNRARLKGAQNASAPGCFATSMELPLLPLARAGLLDGQEIKVVAMTGSSGSGAAASAGTHHPVRANNVKTYSPLRHRHQPEVEMALRMGGARDLQVEFVPISGPYVRGIFTTIFIEVDASLSQGQIEALADAYFADHPFTRRPQDRLPEVAAVAGSNYAEVGYKLGPARGGRRTLSCFSASDNLIKGGAGQAIQCMNLLLGLDEAASLADPGSWP